jgi:hypothetical protein
MSRRRSWDALLGATEHQTSARTGEIMTFKVEIKAKNENGKLAVVRQYEHIVAPSKIEAVNWAEKQAKEFGLDAIELNIVENKEAT